ncbi:DEP domain-containing protein 1A [Chanos chanos]|uniref:DEP domain-containing protein 1A n=1 Tax=Chanos chanos TaxID=29144 RepID=A0A6J2W8Y6_CHACN|nr:DEP domain-containing protein 1A-like [Chanos chanos]
MSSHIITPGPYRATKLWNEVTKLFRAGMPLRKHRQHFRVYSNCFTAVEAVDWLHDLLRHNINFGPDVTRPQTVQLLKKFLKNHVIEDVKGRWGLEDLDDNNHLYRFPSTSPLKPIPDGKPVLRKRSGSIKDRDSFFKFRSSKIFDKEVQENVDPESQASPTEAESAEVPQCREITEEDVQNVWRNVTLTHLQKILGLTSLDEVVDLSQVSARCIVYNVTKVNKHGVVALEDKTEDFPHWVLSAMKCLANWPKYDSNQPSYPGFERDVFKTVSDYFCSLPQPLLTFQYYELFVNILVLCGYVTAPKTHRGKRKNQEAPLCPQPAKAPHLNPAISFRSTECLLLSLIRKEAFEETDSPMREVFGSKAESRLTALKTGQKCLTAGGRTSAGHALGGSCFDLPRSNSIGESTSVRLRPRSCSVETILDASADSCSQRPFFKSIENLLTCKSTSSSQSPPQSIADSSLEVNPKMASLSCNSSPDTSGSDVYSGHTASSSGNSVPPTNRCPVQNQPTNQRATRARPRSTGNCIDVLKHRDLSASCSSINAPVAEITMRPDFSSTVDLRGPNLHGSCMDVRAGPGVGRRCQSSLDLYKPALAHLSVSTVARYRQPRPEQSVIQPPLERVAIEALQLCTLLLPPASRRKLQLLLRMVSRMCQNVDMPRLHDAIGTRTLMVQAFSRCVLRCEEEMDLDELLATRLLSFLIDHHQEVLQVPVYLRAAVEDHLSYLRTQTTRPILGAGVSMPTYSFCRQISSQEFEEQKYSVSQAAIADLLESLIKDKTMSVKEKKKRLKLFQKEYPDIYSCRFPTTESEAQLFADKPKIKPPMLISLKKTKTFGIRN